jgi:hypothetical protein
MKTGKFTVIFALIAIIGSVSTAYGDTPAESAFYGTWVCPQSDTHSVSQTIVITKDNFKLTDSDGGYFYFTIDSWMDLNNPNSENNSAYPQGYLLNGNVSEKKEYNFSRTTIFIYLHSNGRSLIWSGTSSGAGGQIFSKQ